MLTTRPQKPSTSPSKYVPPGRYSKVRHHIQSDQDDSFQVEIFTFAAEVPKENKYIDYESNIVLFHWLWNRLPAEILETLPGKPNAFRKRVRKVINVVH